MTGPEHYAEAERLLAEHRAFREQHKGAVFTMTPLELSEAQVHATLAVAAATALPNATPLTWRRVAAGGVEGQS